MKRRITTLPGDGIGPEVTSEAVRVLQTIAGIHGFKFEFEEHAIGGVAIKKFGSPLPRTTLDACLASDAVLLGAVGAPEYDRTPPNQRPEAGLLLLRSALGGYANLRPAISYASIAACSPVRTEVACGADILIVRELLGGLYFGEPRSITSTIATNTMRYSVEEIERIAKVAFEAARKRRGKVTSVDKANVLDNPLFAPGMRGDLDQVTSVLFLDLEQLLALGEQAGLGDSPDYQQLKSELSPVRTVNAITRAKKTLKETEIFIEVP